MLKVTQLIMAEAALGKSLGAEGRTVHFEPGQLDGCAHGMAAREGTRPSVHKRNIQTTAERRGRG